MSISRGQEVRMAEKHSARPRALSVRLLLLAVLLLMVFVLAVSSLLRGSARINSLQFDTDSSERRGNFLVKGKPAAPSQSQFPSFVSSEDEAPRPRTTTMKKKIVEKVDVESGPYHDWQHFALDFQEMLRNFKVYVYPDAFANQSYSESSQFAPIFLPHPDPFHPRRGNYFSEHMFKLALLGSSIITPHPEEAHLFFLPFSINLLRNDPRVHSEASISEFVTRYITRIRRQFPLWNASAGADHFYVYCHSVGREVASGLRDLLNNAIQVTCSSSYFQRCYVTHKDVAFPQVWPRLHEEVLTPPDARHKLVFFSGRIQNSVIRQELITLWENDSDMDVFSGSPPYPYEEGFRRSKYCLHVKGYEVNTARVSDAIHYGCVPVIISNHYELPFANILDWSKFSVIINHGEISLTKQRLLSIPRRKYLNMFHNLRRVRRHFLWHETPRGFDSFHMTAYQLWLRRSIHRLRLPH
ncbi:hypothetical protein I3843_05G087900 [Carya illinoinensis]|nr:probable glycosyltransferase At3g07620 [Carya illinoinensis]KAG2706318.1 hypothetical protein I3760_05G098000 [Carya illinoinensis]KAG7978558.1 hypothetical protein I3843_05G087900 [Carya illinoinensis]